LIGSLPQTVFDLEIFWKAFALINLLLDFDWGASLTCQPDEA
jgi:hypothetical protein